MNVSQCIAFLWMFLLSTNFIVGSVNSLAASGSPNKRSKNNKKKKANRNPKSSSAGTGGFGAASSSTQQQKTTTKTCYVPDTSEATHNLISFLSEQECEGIGSSSSYEGGGGGGGLTEIGLHGKTGIRGLFATDDVQAGEFLLGIPFPCCLTLANDDIAVEEASDAELGRRLLVQMTTRGDGDEQKSNLFFKPYFQTLPTPQEHFDATPDFWTDKEIEALEFPPLMEKALIRKRQIQELSESQGIELDRLQFATWLVKSRGFTLLKPVGDFSNNGGGPDGQDDKKLLKGSILSKTVLMPYLDMINHNAEHPNAELQVLETKAEEESFYALQAIRPISKGKEITISYGTGQDSTLELFSNYGFLPQQQSKNPNDVVLVQDEKYKDYPWSTTLKEDEQQLTELLESGAEVGGNDHNGVLKRILQFRIRMKRAAKTQK